MRLKSLISAIAVCASIGSAAPVWAQSEDFTPVTDEMLASPANGDWLLWRRALDSWGYSPLDQINTENVAQLTLAWGWSMEPGWQETAPIVYDGVMYIANPDGIAQALDAADGELLWEYRREMPEDFRDGMMSRGLAIYGDKVFFATPDAGLVALDAQTGQVVWETDVAGEGKTVTAAPVVADGKVIVGYMGCFGFEAEKCGVAAFDTQTGEEVWRTITVSDAPEGEDSWNGLPYVLRGGGDIWTSASYDAEQELVYIGVSQAKPWARASRQTGDEATLYTNATLALDPDTGEIEWYRQYIPGETNDMDEAFEHILVDIDGEPAYVNMGKLAILWRGSRVDGEPMPAFDLGWQDQIDITESGEFAGYREGKVAALEEVISFCPSTTGFRAWRAMAYSPETRAVYIPMSINCDIGAAFGEVEMVEGGGGNGRLASERAVHPDSPDHIGRFVAQNIDTGEVLWEMPLRTPANTAMLTTAGGLVFGGDWDRHMYAFDEVTGDILWETRLPQAAQGYPISYAVDGKQYIAVPVGVGGYSWSSSVPRELTPEVSRPSSGNAVLVFALPEA
ncbi:pyrroloquinoline quinone-dependent dehydrogenase [Pelagibacterium xiamenense]|uniref:pyrroloquinoline quinone-dependent dehydrogenase n=1 Tax=Pelagibacterium xiamenense TaxID=2901140 RepID=UPI001E4886D5|nr:PQQ-binding-like beta-propeller repeat protein [Pelagibacterium xiamenense]MCD7059588.1 PQQ-binding-like beta-propeller repeat protein [Pelagibacterium xiamenense]